MLENAVYSVISPESCSSILWRDWDHKREAAQILSLTAQDLYRFQIVDQVVPEPPGGAHTDAQQAAARLRAALAESLRELSALSPAALLRLRQERLRKLATFVSES